MPRLGYYLRYLVKIYMYEWLKAEAAVCPSLLRSALMVETFQP
jgi:hypothetical protein